MYVYIYVNMCMYMYMYVMYVYTHVYHGLGHRPTTAALGLGPWYASPEAFASVHRTCVKMLCLEVLGQGKETVGTVGGLWSWMDYHC